MPAIVAQTIEFLGEVRSEIKKVTWPDRNELRRYTIAILVFVLIVAGFIAILDVFLQGVLVKGIPALFRK